MREKLSINVLIEWGLVSQQRGAGCERSFLVVADYLFCFATSVIIAGACLAVIRVRFTSTVSRSKDRKERDACARRAVHCHLGLHPFRSYFLFCVVVLI